MSITHSRYTLEGDTSLGDKDDTPEDKVAKQQLEIQAREERRLNLYFLDLMAILETCSNEWQKLVEYDQKHKTMLSPLALLSVFSDFTTLNYDKYLLPRDPDTIEEKDKLPGKGWSSTIRFVVEESKDKTISAVKKPEVFQTLIFIFFSFFSF